MLKQKQLLGLLLATALLSPLVQADTTLGTKSFGAEQTYLQTIYSQVGRYKPATAPQLAQGAIDTYFSALIQQAQSLNTPSRFPTSNITTTPAIDTTHHKITSPAPNNPDLPVLPATISVTTPANTANTNLNTNTNKPIPSGFSN